MQETICSIEGVTKSLSPFYLGPIDLVIEEGSVVVVVGPNGSGKTTLLHTIMNIVHPDAGAIRLFGRSQSATDIELKQKIAYVPDLSVGHDEVNAVELGQFVSEWYPAWNQPKYDELIQRFQINPHTHFGKLSRGMKKALSLAVSFASEPELLLLDEPTSGLDLFAKRILAEEIVQFLQKETRSILLTNHILDDVRRLADYIALLHRGKLLGVYEKDTLLNDWKVLWLDKMPQRIETIPGYVDMIVGTPIQLVTNTFQQTEQALIQQNIGIIQTQAMELDDILTHLIKREG